MRTFIVNVPLFFPGVILAAVLAVVLSAPLARVLRTDRRLAAFGLLSLGVIVAATLTPGTDAIAWGIASDGRCDLTGFELITVSRLMRIDEASLNVLLFVPLGLAIGLLPHSRRSMAVLAFASLLPFLVEATQALLPQFGRGCEGADMANNLAGLLVGLAIGGVARVVLAR